MARWSSWSVGIDKEKGHTEHWDPATAVVAEESEGQMSFHSGLGFYREGGLSDA